MPFKLIAEYGEEEMGTKEFGEFETLEAAKAEVDRMEKAATWPEGWDAIATNIETGERFMYGDDWESMKDWASE